MYGIEKEELKKRIGKFIDEFALKEYIDYPISTYSGGIKRRLDIAVNMISYPKILFLDEPTVGIDIYSRKTIWEMLKRIKDEYGTTIFLTTHYLEEAQELSDYICIMKNGDIAVQGTIKDLEKNKTIYGYHTLINWDKTNHDVCTAVIQVNAKPERDYGYDRIAKKIYNFPEVDTMYLLAGNYEFLLIVKGKTMVEVAKFVNSRLAVIEGIERTATMYVLKQYKNMGRLVEDDNKDAAERLLVTP